MTIQFKWVPNISDIPQEAWDALAQPLDFPFLEWHWLAALETTGCVGGETGWMPIHLTGWRNETLIAAAPLYIKVHSWGEFVFDQFWARAAMAFNLPYYPKLVGMSPFTPVPGYRFLIADGEQKQALQQAMISIIDAFCKENKLGGFHLLHIDPQWKKELEDLGFHAWQHFGLVWQNQNFGSFADYLGQFRSHRRKTIRRERRHLAEQEIHYQVCEGETITSSDIENMYNFYADTCAKYWGGSQYLNNETFHYLRETFSHRLVLQKAHHDESGVPVAMSMLFRKNDHLYGRYWGCLQDIDGLHFETCYYQPIEWAVGQGIQTYDAGSGGARHKHRRGFLASLKYSLHKVYHPALNSIWLQHIDQVNQETQATMDEMNQKFKKS